MRRVPRSRFYVNGRKIEPRPDVRILKYVSNSALEGRKMRKYASAENAESGKKERKISKTRTKRQINPVAKRGATHRPPHRVTGEVPRHGLLACALQDAIAHTVLNKGLAEKQHKAPSPWGRVLPRRQVHTSALGRMPRLPTATPRNKESVSGSVS